MSLRATPSLAEPPPLGALASMRALADQAFSRAAGAPLIPGNSVRLLKDATENYPAWLEAISGARQRIHFESYFIEDDRTGEVFAEALIRKAREGVRVRLVYDWLGSFGKASGRFWQRMREAGIEVRSFNPPRFDSPLGWLSRDHRKMLVVDGRVGFVSGLCVGAAWEGEPEKGIAPWRDTGVEIRGPAVVEVERAFAEIWQLMGPPIPESDLDCRECAAEEGDVALRVVATVPATAGMLRLDQLMAALARKRIWITDAYYGGLSIYVQALRAAARAGVDVRLLLPNTTDLPLLQPLSRAGYRPLLEAGVRIFEWKGPMLHAKTAVTDGRWARVGSTNLNIASWLGNCELDVVIEDSGFASVMEEQYLRDLEHATEIVLDSRHKLYLQTDAGLERASPILLSKTKRPGPKPKGSASPVASGAIRLGHALGAAVADRRVLEPFEARLMLAAAASILSFALLVALFPRPLAYATAAIAAWFGITLVLRAASLFRKRGRKDSAPS